MFELDNTKKFILLIAIIILIIYLIIIGLAIYTSQYKQKYPPITPSCPDYWEIGENNICKNKKNLGLCLGTDDLNINLNNEKWKGKTGECAKYQFTKRCNILWDGISDNNKLCN